MVMPSNRAATVGLLAGLAMLSGAPAASGLQTTATVRMTAIVGYHLVRLQGEQGQRITAELHAGGKRIAAADGYQALGADGLALLELLPSGGDEPTAIQPGDELVVKVWQGAEQRLAVPVLDAHADATASRIEGHAPPRADVEIVLWRNGTERLRRDV